MADPPPYPGTPRWVKVSGVAAGILALLVVILIHAGRGHNLQSGGGIGGHTTSESGHR
jgi:hypothetical protein